MTTKKIALSIGVVVLVGALFWSIYKGPLWNRSSENVVPPSIVADTDKEEAKTDSPSIEYGYTTASSTLGKKSDIPTPSLSRPIVIPKSFSSEIATLAKERIEALVNALKTSPENATLWGNLGMARKGIEDYEGSKEAYEYALKLQPNNSVFADNIGVIYGDYLKDYSRAEQHYRLAITLDPKAGYRYLRLFEFYRYLLNDMPKAKAILEEGLRAIPGDSSFTELLETM
ncbi:MAG: tetratricopeptide repeat protein [bacterium]|nr:tetratricopeptide repeat protein [bacterium]